MSGRGREEGGATRGARGRRTSWSAGATGTGDVFRDMIGVCSNSRKKVGLRELAAENGFVYAGRREGARAGSREAVGRRSAGEMERTSSSGSGGARAGAVRNRGREIRERILRIVVVVASVVDGRGRDA